MCELEELIALYKASEKELYLKCFWSLTISLLESEIVNIIELHNELLSRNEYLYSFVQVNKEESIKQCIKNNRLSDNDQYRKFIVLIPLLKEMINVEEQNALNETKILAENLKISTLLPQNPTKLNALLYPIICSDLFETSHIKFGEPSPIDMEEEITTEINMVSLFSEIYNKRQDAVHKNIGTINKDIMEYKYGIEVIYNTLQKKKTILEQLNESMTGC